MLALNDVKIDLKSKDDKTAKKIAAWYEKMKEISNNDIRLSFTSTHVTEPDPSTGQPKENAQVVNIPTEVVLLANDEKWNYYDNRKKDKNDEFKYTPKYFKFTGDMHFNDAYADIGLLYFLVVLSPYCEKIPNVKDADLAQNPKQVQKVYRVEMPVFDADNKLAARRLKSKLENKIYNEMTSDEIKLIGYAMKMKDLDRLTDSQVRNTVCDYVSSSKDLIDEFLERCVYKPKNDMDADIQKAIEQNVIVLQKPRGIHRWHFVIPNSREWGDMICEVSPGENDRDCLAAYLTEHEKVYELIKSKLF